MHNQQLSGTKKGKGRPSVMQIGETKRKLDYQYDPEYRSIEVWNQKLENMLTILQAADMTKKEPLDEFQRMFKETREQSQ